MLGEARLVTFARSTWTLPEAENIVGYIQKPAPAVRLRGLPIITPLFQTAWYDNPFTPRSLSEITLLSLPQLEYKEDRVTTVYRDMGLFTAYVIHSPSNKKLATRVVSQFIEYYCNFFMFLLVEK